MSAHRLDDGAVRDAHEAVRRHGSVTAAARALGIPRTTLQSRLRQETAQEAHFEFPQGLPSQDLPVEQLIERMAGDFRRRAEAHAARRILKVKARAAEPIALCWFGDPHIDDNGCDWPALLRHIEIVKSTPGMYACNLGDTTNNWVGRLQALYGHQNTTKRDAVRLTEWLFAAMPWFVVILGNHDLWSGADSPIQFLRNHCGDVSEWAARFQIEFPNGFTFDVDARHDHPGHSQDNPLHGQMKAKIRHPDAQDADLIIGGHRHTAAISAQEDVRRNRITWFARARGYKYHDDYALTRGYAEQRHGQAVVSVIDPTAESPMAACACFLDVAEAARYLTYLRSKSHEEA